MISVIDWINEAVGRVVSLFAGLFAVIIIYDVFMRYVMNSPTPWGFDLTKMIYAFYFIMLGGYALRHQAHVKAVAIEMIAAVKTQQHQNVRPEIRGQTTQPLGLLEGSVHNNLRLKILKL